MIDALAMQAIEEVIRVQSQESLMRETRLKIASAKRCHRGWPWDLVCIAHDDNIVILTASA